MNQLDRVVQIGIGNRGFVFHVVVHRLVVDRIRRHEPDLDPAFLKTFAVSVGGELRTKTSLQIIERACAGHQCRRRCTVA